MKKPDTDWYRKIWTLDIKDMSWVESTNAQVDFILRLLGLRGNEKVLDLACGYGRHALELARRGFDVTGVDITEAYVEDARQTAARENLRATFLCDDIRNISYESEFDVVLNIADGAIGYLENDEENGKIFDRIAHALRPNGKHFMDLCNARFAEKRFPLRNWDIGKKTLSLPEFTWEAKERRMLYGGWGIEFGSIASPPESIAAHSSIRLYSVEELGLLLSQRNMIIVSTRGNYTDQPLSEDMMQMNIYARKNP